MRKKLWVLMSLLLIVALVISVTGCSAKKEAKENKVYNIKLGTVWPADHPTSKVIDEVFIPYVEKNTNGNVKIEHYPNFQLGSERALGESAMSGQVEMVAIGNLIMTVVPELKIGELPFMWEKEDDFWQAIDGEYGGIVRKAMEDKGLKNITFYRRGFRNITSIKPINSIEDLKGFKLRVPEVDYYVEMAKCFGASPTVIAWPEVYTALQQHVAEGQENPLETIYSMKFYEVQPYLAKTDHILTFGQVMANKKYWDSLPEEYQKVIMDAGQELRVKQGEIIENQQGKMLEDMVAKGIVVTEPDRKPFIEATKSVRANYVKENPWAKEIFAKLGIEIE